MWYDDALAGSSPAPPDVVRSPDDLYILYTGGTTGMPKGVLWRNGDAMIECFGGSADGHAIVAGFVAEANAGPPFRALIAPPFMHGAGHWVALNVWLGGGTVFVLPHPEHLDPAEVWRLVEGERIDFLLIVGDAFARPLLDELGRGTYDASSLNVLMSGGAALSVGCKAELLAPPADRDGRRRHGVVGGRWTAGPRVHGQPMPRPARSPRGRATTCCPPTSAGCWRPTTTSSAGSPRAGGWRSATSATPTRPPARTRSIDGVRYAVPGDRARWRADGTIELHGRDSVTINSGGEKIFAEEVELAVKAHPDVYDCVVAGRPSERWGSEVVAIVRRRQGADVTPDALLAVAADHIARYKLPKGIVFVDEIVRSPSGKADYRWARQIAAASTHP